MASGCFDSAKAFAAADLIVSANEIAVDLLPASRISSGLTLIPLLIPSIAESVLYLLREPHE